MKIKRDTRKLALSRETLQGLEDQEAKFVVGGVGSGRYTFCAGCTLGGSCH